MKYTYRNLKHVQLHGIEPFGEKTFDRPIEGGGIELVQDTKSKKSKTNKENDLQ